MTQLLVSLLCSALLVLWFYYAFIVTFRSAPYYPSMGKDVRGALKKYVKSGKQFIDIGCGDGRILLQAGKLGAKVTGIDINPFMALIARMNLLLHRQHGQVLQANMYKFDYAKYDIIYVYLLIDTMNQMLPVIQKTASPGTIVIANTFKFKDLKPIDKIGKVNIYRMR